MTAPAPVPGWQLAAAAALALVAVVVPVSLGRPAVQVAAGAIAAGMLTYVMRGRGRRRQDLAIGMTLVALVGVAVSAQVAPSLGLTWFGVIPLAWLLRGEREARRDEATIGQPLTGWRGRAAVAGVGLLVAGAIAYVAVTVRSVEDLGAFAGPPAAAAIAAVLGSVVVLLRRTWVGRGLSGWKQEAGRDVPAVVRAIAAERALAPADRRTGADDTSLDGARDHAELAVMFLESGPSLEAVHELERLLQVAGAWEDSAALTRQVAALEPLVRRGRRTRGRVDTELRRDAASG